MGGGDTRAAAVARDYLERAGLQLPDTTLPRSAGVMPTIDAHEATAQGDLEQPHELAVAVADSTALQALAGRPELEEAAAALAGAFAAVEAIKSALGLARPATLPAELSLHGEERA
jgi:hypothetical protein